MRHALHMLSRREGTRKMIIQRCSPEGVWQSLPREELKRVASTLRRDNPFVLYDPQVSRVETTFKDGSRLRYVFHEVEATEEVPISLEYQGEIYHYTHSFAKLVNSPQTPLERAIE